MSNPNSLFLLADHIKLSLLERQRAKAADSDNDNDEEDGHIARSLEQLREGIEHLEREQARLESEGEEGKALDIGDALPGLHKKLASLEKQFADNKSDAKKSKSVRFQSQDVDLEAQRATLFNQPYTDDPEDVRNDYSDQDNVQLHQMHARIMDEQDAQLDALGASISRQRELSMQIGDELDSQVAMLEESEQVVDRHQTRLDRARQQVGKISRSAGDCKQMVAIVVLIVILVLLIAILK